VAANQAWARYAPRSGRCPAGVTLVLVCQIFMRMAPGEASDIMGEDDAQIDKEIETVRPLCIPAPSDQRTRLLTELGIVASKEECT
jgi:hypothetical protein